MIFQKVRELILTYFTSQKEVLKKPLPNVIVEEIGDSSIKVKVLFWVDILKVTVQKDDSDTGELVKSKVIREIKFLLLANGFNLPSTIIGHKMYKKNAPLEIAVSQK